MGHSEWDGRLERRRKPRTYTPFPARVSGVDERGERFEAAAVLDDLSATGLHFKLPRTVVLGEKLRLVIRLSITESEEVPVARVEVEGIVMRREQVSAGMWGLGLVIIKRKLLR